MARFSDELLDRVRDAAPIESVVEDYVTLKKSGKHLKGLCPFHTEKTPSFTVSPDTGLFYCYGCHKGGNVFTFLMEVEKLPFPEAVRQLSERFGVPLPARDEPRQGMDILEVNRWALGVYQRYLMTDPGGRAARDYLRGRRISPESIRVFGLGAVPDQWQFLVHRADKDAIPAELLLQSGLAIPRKDGRGLLDRFRNRLMFPLHSTAGHVVGFAGRVLPSNTDDAKYVNSPESSTYHKSRFVYGMHQARTAMRQKGRALLVEGYFDVIRCHERGFDEAVAVSGTSLTVEQVDILRRKAPEIVVMFDGDTAGQAAAQRAVGILLEGALPCRIVCLPAEEDPDSLLTTHGPAAVELAISQAPSAVQFLVSRAWAAASHARDVARVVGPVLGRIPDPLLREEAARELARILGFTPQAVQSVIRPVGERVSPPQGAGIAEPRTAWEEQVCRHLLMRPAEREHILEDVEPKDFTSPQLRRLCDWIRAHGGTVEARRLVDRIDDPDLREVALGLVMHETPLGPVEKDLMRFRLEKLVRMKRTVRDRIREAEARGALQEVQSLLPELSEISTAVDDLRHALANPVSTTQRRSAAP